MKILILHMRFHPDLTGTGPLVTDLATDLVSMGNAVTVVTSMPHYGKKDIDAQYRGRLIARENFHGVDVLRTFVYIPPNARGFYRGINYLSYTFMSVAAGCISEKPDIILCINPPITVGFSGWLMRLARQAPIVFNVQDIWPDCIVIIDQLRNPFIIRIFKVLEKVIYRVSACVTVLSDGMKQNLKSKGVPDKKIVIIPNWADIDHIRPVPRDNSFRRDNNLKDLFVVMFAGNLGFISMLDMILDTAKILGNDKNIIFFIVGEGNAKAGLMERAKKMELSNVRFLPTQPKEVLPDMLGSADISLVTLNSRLGLLNVPSKTYSIMASGRPVLASVPDDSEIARLVKDANCGVLVPPEDPQALAQIIKKLSKQPELLDRYGSNGRRYVTAHFSRRTVTRRYHELLHQVTSKRR
jgi:colanic acid biosynthesis glycosyl transferase WcaI